MVGARTAELVVPPTIYRLSNFHRVAPAGGVCLGLAAGALVSTLFVTETPWRNIWRRAAH